MIKKKHTKKNDILGRLHKDLNSPQEWDPDLGVMNGELVYLCIKKMHAQYYGSTWMTARMQFEKRGFFI